MAELRRSRKNDESDEPPPKRAASSSTTYTASQANLVVSPAAPTPTTLCRRPISAGRFAGSYFSPRATYSTTAPNANAFSRSAFAKMVIRKHQESQQAAAAAMRISSERVPIFWPICHEEITKQKIGIIGAGMAGLYAALILDSLGFTNYEILEANPERVGGRVFTRYFDASALKNSKWNYIDFGAMRFPSITIMDRVIGRQRWSLVNYLNHVVKEEHLKIKLLDYQLSVPNNINYYNTTRKTNAELQDNIKEVDPLHFGKSNGGGVDDKYVQEWYTTWLNPAFDSFKEKMHVDFNTGFRALMDQDRFSVRAYLRAFKLESDQKSCEYPQELIDYLETLDSATGHYDDAFSEAVMDSFDFDSPSESGDVQWKCVAGGTSQFAHAMLSVIKSKPKMNKRVTKIVPSSTSKDDIDVLFVTDGESGESQESRTYHHVINTLPPAVLRSLDTAECNFSYEKRTALRLLRVDSSLKIGLLFKSRWWQDPKVMRGKPIKGGQSSTDLPIRTIVYPSYGIDDPDAAGVLIASYAWGQDAARLSSLAAGQPTQLVQLAISNIATVHDLHVEFLQEQYTGKYFIQDWDQYAYSQGAFALFGPGQFTSLFPGLLATEMEGRYHTAGEMASVHHAWIVGALNSAWRCVHEILKASTSTDSHKANAKIRELKQKWGELDDVDLGLWEKNELIPY